MESIRQILLNVEALEFEDGEPPELYRAKTTNEAYQIAIMKDAGLVEASITKTCRVPNEATIDRMTWAGHEFLDASRDNKIWKMAKEHVIKSGMSWAFPILLEWLNREARQRLFGTTPGTQ